MLMYVREEEIDSCRSWIENNTWMQFALWYIPLFMLIAALGMQVAIDALSLRLTSLSDVLLRV